MPTFLRTVQKSRWHPKPEWKGWGHNELQGDALLDLQTKGNALSVFSVDEGADIDRIVSALAATRQYLSHLDYVVFDDISLMSSGIAFIQTDGETPDKEVNDVHYDVVNLTVSKLVQVAQIVSKCKRQRITKREMKSKLQLALDDQRLDSNKVNDSLLGQLS